MGAVASPILACASVALLVEACSSSESPAAPDAGTQTVEGTTSRAFTAAARAISAKCLAPGCPAKGDEDCLVAEISSTCLPLLADAGTSCEGLLFYCANQVMAAAFPPSACADAGK